MPNRDHTQAYHDYRRNYEAQPLSKAALLDNPLTQTHKWLNEAIASNLLDPTAASLATVSPKGQPSNRMILIKEITDHGLIFYTHYLSQKGQNIAQNPQVSLLFYWDKLHRQIRIEGHAEKIPLAHSEAYFKKRPKESQIMTSISIQSQPIQNRDTLESLFEAKKNKAEPQISLPENWGGYIIIPEYYEFWHGRENRLHDRISYTKKGPNQWIKTRLQP